MQESENGDIEEFEIGDKVYHIEFRKDGQQPGEGTIEEVFDEYEDLELLVAWKDGITEWYDQYELEKVLP